MKKHPGSFVRSLSRRGTARRRLQFEQFEDRRMLALTEFLDPNPNPGNGFGTQVVPLSTANVVVTSPYDDAGGTDAGAVYLFNGQTGELISALRGSSANDNIGSGGVTAVGNGNYVVQSPNWDNGPSNPNVGAVTWGNGTSGISGTVSPANSLVGGKGGDSNSQAIVVLSNGNYVVRTPYWDNGESAYDAGAVTWGNGATGIGGAISSANSLIGAKASDQVGSGVTALSNGNYVVRSGQWDNGTIVDAGAVTWGNGTTGITGAVSAANSLVGSTTGDLVGYDNNYSVTVLTNGNYVVGTGAWDNGAIANAGAATWGSGTTGVSGVISAANSLVGSKANDSVGQYGAVALSNGNYVVRSAFWDNGTIVDAGAVTWGDGSAGISGAASSANSLVGTTASDQVGGGNITPLSNGNYVVASFNWDNGAVANAGAVTWGNGTTGISGAVSSANSLVGATANDQVGSVTALSNGNYVVRTSGWDNGSAINVGAVTWGNGSTGISGPVSSGNSLVGTTAGDGVGNAGVTALSNGNYVVGSGTWDNGSVANVGAVTWGNGTTGISGAVSSANSLVGTTAGDQVGSVSPLTNGNYVVRTLFWDNGAAADAGAVTWGNGSTGISGSISSANSLVGTNANDQVGNAGVSALSNGNYVVGSFDWDNGSVTNAGAVTWGNGATGISGAVSSANSLVGTTAWDQVSAVTALSNGNYVVRSPSWDNGSVANVGAVTWGNGSTGISGAVSSANSLVGSKANSSLNGATEDPVNTTFYARFLADGLGGRVRIGSTFGGALPVPVGYIDDDWAALAPGTLLTDADPGTPGNQPATYGYNAFAALPTVVHRVAETGLLNLLDGTYADDVTLPAVTNLRVPSGLATLSGVLSGPGLRKLGAGSLVLTLSNSFGGGIEVDRGSLLVGGDLGSLADPIVVKAGGELIVTDDLTTSRRFLLEGGRLSVASGKTLTLQNAAIDGGVLRGPGTIVTTASGSTSFTATQSTASLVIDAQGTDRFADFTNKGVLSLAAGKSFLLSNFENAASGRLNVDGTADVQDLLSYGQINVAANGALNNTGDSGLTFGGGSVTLVAADGTLEIGSLDALVVGGLVKNFGEFGSATNDVVVDFGGKVTGSGTFHAVVTQNGGIYSPGASPGGASLSKFLINGGGIYDFELTNATGTGGNVNGWDTATVAPNAFSPASAELVLGATAANPYTILITSRVNNGGGNTPGAAANFNPQQGYAWKFLDGSHADTTVTGTFDPDAFSVVTSGFENSTTGEFSVELRDGGKNLYVVYVPTNEPPTFTSSPGLTVVEDAVYTYHVSAADADAGAVLSITASTLPTWLTLTDHGDGTATLTGTPGNIRVGANNVVLEVSDGTHAVQQPFTITVTNINDAPVLNTGVTVNLNPIAEDTPTASNAGTLVSDLLGGITDVDAGALKGIAVSSANNTAGTWQYTLDGTNWQNFGTVSRGAVRLLAADVTTRVRLLPKANFNGTASLWFFAWDQTSGTPGGTANLTPAGTTGGTTAFSTAVRQAFLSVTPVNDAPKLNTGVAVNLNPIAEDTPAASNAGTLVSAILGGITDVDAGAVKGIAVSSANNIAGTWQYTLDGTNWLNFGTVSRSAVRLLPANATTRVRLLPKANFNGTASLWFFAWDQTSGTPGGTANLTPAGTTGGTTAFSTAVRQAFLSVTPVNDAPKLNTGVAVNLDPIAEDSTPAGTLVSSLLGGITDVDAGALKGIAVSSANNIAGTWQYTLDGTNWLNFGAVSRGAVRLLPANATARVRLLPSADFNGTASIWFFAWDQTSGTPGGTANLTPAGTTGGTTAFSTNVRQAFLSVTPVNDAPVLAGISGTIGYTRNAPPVVLASGATVTDVDHTVFDGGELRVWNSLGGDNNDTLAVGSGFTVDQDNNVFYGATLIGSRTSSGIGSSELKVQFHSTATKAIVQQLVRSITYQNIGGSAGTRTIAFTVSDGDGGLSDERIKTVNVT